jgi:hypothetical protein
MKINTKKYFCIYQVIFDNVKKIQNYYQINIFQ